MDSAVIVLKGKDPYLTTKKALGQFRLPSLKGRRILIKPNAARLAVPGEGVTTHPRVVEAAIDHLKEKGVDEIAIGESCIFGVDPEQAFWVTGLREVSEKKGVELIDLDRVAPMEIKIPEGKALKSIRVPAILKKFDFIISIPVMKTHMHTRVTLSIKNMKGLLWRREKARLHQLRYNGKVAQGDKALDIAISDMASVLFPHLAIIDGTTGLEGMGPAYGRKKEAGLIVLGNNPVSADAVAARLMGFGPEEVPHLRLLSERGLGEIQLSNISIKPEDFLRWETPFEFPPSQLSFSFPDVVVYDEGSCSACLSTLFVLLHCYKNLLTSHRLGDNKIHIGIGKHLGNISRGTLLIGNCTHKMKKRGIFVKGCPPVASEVLKLLSSLGD
ncbi:MAG: DUF362 domain-containing protein [Deltaproteobacteria bacterium]|nr:DUF362 domain-containing protein [Deltaproteobacteria bacterium]MBM4322969.1 DUF362 domain-containing protein [Deltaproteobacteria bacterium]